MSPQLVPREEVGPGHMIGEGLWVFSTLWNPGRIIEVQAGPCVLQARWEMDDGRPVCIRGPEWGEVRTYLLKDLPPFVVRGVAPPTRCVSDDVVYRWPPGHPEEFCRHECPMATQRD